MLIAKLRRYFMLALLSAILMSHVVLWDGSKQAVEAHRPHDVITQVISTQTADQGTRLYTLVRSNFFWSEDGGQSWRRADRGLNLQLSLSDLAVDPQNPQLLYLASEREGAFKSTDGGLTWSAINQGLDNLELHDIAVAPNDSDLVYATGRVKGLYRSDDGGQQWTSLLADTEISQLAFVPDGSGALVIGDHQGKLAITRDRGETWDVLQQMDPQESITAIAFSPKFSADQTLWMGTETQGIWQGNLAQQSFQPVNQGINDKRVRDIAVLPGSGDSATLMVSTWSEAVYVSQDDGASWQLQKQGLTKSTQADQLKQPHFDQLALSAQFPQDQTLYLGGFNGLFQSTDGGKTWQELDTLSGSTVVAMDVSPNYGADGTVVAVTYVGLPYLTRDQGETWLASPQGLEVPRFTNNFREVAANDDPRRFFDVAFSPNYGQDQTLFASLLWSKIIRSTDGGQSWQIIALPKEERGPSIAVSPNYAQDQTLYVTAQSGIIYRSQNQGKSFSKFSNLPKVTGNSGPSLVASPAFAEDQTLFAASDQGIHRSQNGGKKWQLSTAPEQLKNRYIQLAISPNFAEDQRIYAGTNVGIYLSDDGGERWTKLAAQGLDPDYTVESLAISPNFAEDQTLLVSVRSQGLFKSVDQGQSFTAIGDRNLVLSRLWNVPSSGISLRFSPNFAEDQTVFGFGSAALEVYQSTDAGNTWTTQAIPYAAYNQYNFATSARLFLFVYRSRILIGLAALVIVVVIVFGLRKFVK